ncbi:HEAT repeat domain-containing protein [Streptomyces sp. NPDC006012]|uniref:HEAT repeat domain-containing protein n=1 Tax=Streptomyces sp. NPDC006012 TaxID=3364739 RepID=UPI0036B4399F
MIESVEEFLRLCSSDDPDEYYRANTEPASLEVWREVVDRYPDARFSVAHNKTVPLEILRVLAIDPDPRVRSMVAMKRKLTADILKELAMDPDESVRLTVARHKRVPKTVLEDLRSDDWDVIREVAQERIRNDY